MPEGEGQQPQLSHREQGNTPTQKSESTQSQVDGWIEHAAAMAGTGNAETRAEQPGSPESPEVVEQRKELVENVQKLGGNLGKFSEINPDTPADPDTKKKLSRADELINQVRTTLKKIGPMALGGTAVVEGLNYFLAGENAIPQGWAAAMIMLPTTGPFVALEAYARAQKGVGKMVEGYGKLKGLISKNKEPEGNKT